MALVGLYRVLDIQPYLGVPHSYGTYDCITLIQQFYQIELGYNFSLPSYTPSRMWMKQYTTEFFDEWAAKYGKKVSLTDAQNYDLISFKSSKTNLLIHFGLYIKPNRMLHVEEGAHSRVDQLSDYWLQHLHAIHRYDKMV
jgi:cell wall-associated NlpC family hydrolase